MLCHLGLTAENSEWNAWNTRSWSRWDVKMPIKSYIYLRRNLTLYSVQFANICGENRMGGYSVCTVTMHKYLMGKFFARQLQ